MALTKKEEHILEHIELTIQTTVNGKLDTLRQLINDQNVVMQRHMSEHSINDEVIRNFITRAEPYIKSAEDNRIAYAFAERKGKLVIFVGSVMAAATGIFIIVKRWLH